MSSTQIHTSAIEQARRVVLFVVVLGSTAMVSLGLHPQDTAHLYVNDPRPVAKAVRTLEDLCGCVITYEDPPFVNSGDVKDITDELRRQSGQSQTGVPTARVVVPKGGSLTVNYSAVRGTERPLNTETALQEVLNANDKEVGAGRFRIEQDNGVLHIIPIAVRNANGSFRPQLSVLDTRISLPSRQRSGLEMVNDICEAITKERHVRVGLGTVPLNLFLQNHSAMGVSNEKARAVLIKFLQNVDNSRRLSWRLLYEPGLKTYALNIHRVS